MNQTLLAGSALADGLPREYTLNEIAIVTRAGPARLLGLTRKGHLGVGADADVTVYARDADVATMFATPRYVVRAERWSSRKGSCAARRAGRRLHVRPGYDETSCRIFGNSSSVSVVRELRCEGVGRRKKPPTFLLLPSVFCLLSYGAVQAQFAASLRSPVPLYFAYCG